MGDFLFRVFEKRKEFSKGEWVFPGSGKMGHMVEPKGALKEIQDGKKCSHWMWFIFPQIDGLGLSSISKEYSIKNKQEAIDYLIEGKAFDSFRVTTKRHYKEFAQTSIEVNIELGAYIQDKTKKKVKLSKPDCT